MNNHDKEEIKKLKEFKKWVIWFRSLTKEEREEYHRTRWGNNNESH